MKEMIKRIGLLVALLGCLEANVSAQQPLDSTVVSETILPHFKKWTVNEIVKGGRIDAIRQLEDGVILCATRGANRGRLFISENYGITWRFLAKPTDHDITCIAETGNRDEFYVLTGYAEVFRTLDGGRNWSLVKTLTENKNKDGYAAAYAIMYTSNGTLLVTDTDSNGGHIYRSTDKGETWTDKGAVGKKGLYRLEKVGNGLVVNGWDGAIYKSIDDGETWNHVQQLTDTALFATTYSGLARLLQGDQAGNVYRSTNLGDAWEKCAKLEGAADDFVDIGYGATYYGTYTDSKCVYLTLNGGTSWWSLGTLPTVEGDWLDHGITVETPDSIITLSGTNKGFMVRSAFAKAFVQETVAKVNGNYREIDAARKIPFQSAIVGSLVDVKELNEPEDIVTHNGFAYIPCRDGNNVAIIDYRNPQKPVLVHSLRDPDILDAFSVALKGDYLYVLSMTNCRISVYDVRDPNRPAKISAITVGGPGSYLDYYHSNYTRLRKIWIDGDYAYITHSSESKVYILDIRKPERPEIISSFHTGDGAFAARVHNEVLYLAAYGPGSSLITVDVRDKVHPVISSKIYDPDLLKGTCALAIKDDALYVVAYNAGTFWSFDIAEPLSPKVLGYIRDPDMRGPGRIAIKDDNAYVLNSINHSLAIIDIKDVGKPVIRSYMQDKSLFRVVYGISIDGDLLLLAGRDASNFVVIDLKQVASL
uniref:hypothetical protein n=1 Tax=Parapedobacter defluvii TaxID=2045106 RepID=UPI00333F800B